MEIDKATLSFFEALNRDGALRAELEKEMAAGSAPMDTAYAFAKKKGFALERASLEAAHRALTSEGELDDSQLDAVAGGFNPQPEPPAYPSDFGSIANIDQNFLSGW